MRDYAKIAPQFWIGATGKSIRKHGAVAQVIALYLLSSPHSNMIGMYHLPIAYLAADTGIPIEGASKALQSLIESGFCGYDYEAEVVFVYEMARFQIGAQLKPGDKQCSGVQNTYDSVPKNCFLSEFYEKYSDAFNMTKERAASSPIEAPSKPLGSQEQEQEKEQKKEKPSCASAPAEREKADNYPPMFLKFWEAYPRKKAKGDALKAWTKIKPSEHLAETILQAVQRAKTSADWLKDNGKFIPYPASWLNATGWEDEVLTPEEAKVAAKFWGDSWPGIEWRAKQLGLAQNAGETAFEFKFRVFKAAKAAGDRVVWQDNNIRQWVSDDAA